MGAWISDWIGARGGIEKRIERFYFSEVGSESRFSEGVERRAGRKYPENIETRGGAQTWVELTPV